MNIYTLKLCSGVFRTVQRLDKISKTLSKKSPSLEILSAMSDICICSTDYMLGKKTENKFVLLDTRGQSDEENKAVVALIDTMKNQSI